MVKKIDKITIKYEDGEEKILDKCILFHFEDLDTNMTMVGTHLTDIVSVENSLHNIINGLAFEEAQKLITQSEEGVNE